MLRWPSVLAFGVPACAIAGPNYFVQSYFLNFATDVLLLAPAAVGVLLASVRVWDAVSDPLTGVLSDRTRSRLGSRRPWLFGAAPFVALAFAVVWNPPAHWESAALLWWAGGSLVFFTTAATAWSIPHAALGAALAHDGHARSKLFGLRHGCMIVGVAASFGAMQWVVNSADPRASVGVFAGGLALLVTAALWIPPLVLREPRPQTAATATPLESVRAVLGNAQARRLLCVGFAEEMAMGAQGVVAPFMAIYVLERPDRLGLLPACFIAPLVLSIPLWIALARRYGRERVWTVALCGGSATYALLFTIDAGDLARALVLLALAGIFSGCGGPIGPSLLSEVIDRDAEASGCRKEGAFFSAWLFFDKASNALAVLLIGLALQMADFVPNAPATPAARFAIRACLGIAPALMFALAVIAMRRYAREAARIAGEASSG